MSNLCMDVLLDIANERKRQTELWGEQSHPFLPTEQHAADWAHDAAALKATNDVRAAEGQPSWVMILLEEFAETFGETDHQAIREEAIQMAAVVVAMVEDIDRRAALQAKEEGATDDDQ